MISRRLRPLLPDELNDEQRAFLTALDERPRPVQRAADGSLEGPFDAMLRAPRSGAALQGVGAALRYRGVLSEREQTVAQHVVDGLTHKEIGAQLYISPKTVEHHVAKIRQKLGATTRAEMLAALRTQLTPT